MYIVHTVCYHFSLNSLYDNSYMDIIVYHKHASKQNWKCVKKYFCSFVWVFLISFSFVTSSVAQNHTQKKSRLLQWRIFWARRQKKFNHLSICYMHTSLSSRWKKNKASCVRSVKIQEDVVNEEYTWDDDNDGMILMYNHIISHQFIHLKHKIILNKSLLVKKNVKKKNKSKILKCLSHFLCVSLFFFVFSILWFYELIRN